VTVPGAVVTSRPVSAARPTGRCTTTG